MKVQQISLEIRIPGWCKDPSVKINGKKVPVENGGQIISINRKWANQDQVIVNFPMEVTASNWGSNSTAIERGPLVYALKVKERWEKGKMKKKATIFRYFPSRNGTFGLVQDAVKSPKEKIKVAELGGAGSDFVWNLAHAPIEIYVPGKQIPAWKAIDGVAFQPQTARDGVYKGKVSDKTTQLTLVPIGCTKVRIVAFPVVK